MEFKINTRLQSAPIVPLIQASDPAVAVEAVRALVEGGLNVVEVLMRTPDALECLNAIIDAVPEAVAGVGTVMNAAQARSAISSGARFIVSPGLDEGVVNIAKEHNLPIYPGIATATELQRAWNMELRLVKFFPASLSGGPAMLSSLATVFGNMQFLPSGGVTALNLADYLAIPAVLACGGSWMTPKKAIAARDFGTVTELARQALEIAKTVKG